MFETIYMNVLVFLGPALLMLLGWGALKLKQLLDTKISNQAINGILSRLSTTTETAVKAVFQAFVEPIKSGGNLTDEQKAQARQAAIDEIKSHFGEKGIKELIKVLGWDSAKVDSNLASTVEAKVNDLKNEQPKE